MGAASVLRLSDEAYGTIRAHLLPASSRHEEAVFVFARIEGGDVFTVLEWLPVPPEGFTHRSPYYLELTDETRAAVIKRAHDLRSSIIEMHSHPLQRWAEFSPSDRHGFLEFVPHVMWRLKQRPYGAIVIASESFDGLAWFSDANSPKPLGIELENGTILNPTGVTFETWEDWSNDHDQ